MDPIGDNRIIEGLVRGDPRAVAELDAWIDVVLLEQLRSAREEWSDIRQEVRIRVFRNLRAGIFDRRCALRTYVHRIAKNVCIDHLRADYRRRNLEERLGASAAPTPQDATAAWVARDLLDRILDAFNAEERSLLLMVFVEHRSYAEIGVELKIPEGTVKSRMFRCKNRILEIRRSLEEIAS